MFRQDRSILCKLLLYTEAIVLSCVFICLETIVHYTVGKFFVCKKISLKFRIAKLKRNKCQNEFAHA